MSCRIGQLFPAQPNPNRATLRFQQPVLCAPSPSMPGSRTCTHASLPRRCSAAFSLPKYRPDRQLAIQVFFCEILLLISNAASTSTMSCLFPFSCFFSTSPVSQRTIQALLFIFFICLFPLIQGHWIVAALRPPSHRNHLSQQVRHMHVHCISTCVPLHFSFHGSIFSRPHQACA